MKYMILLNSNLDHDPEFVTGCDGYLIGKAGEKLFDTWIGSGTLIFGHERSKKSVSPEKMLPNGPTLDCEFTGLISDLVDFEIGAIGLQTGGSAAVSRAIRLARSYTKKDPIAVVGKFWHGSDNEFLFKNNKIQFSRGIPISQQDNMFWFSNISEFINCHNRSDFAALICEPYQGADPSICTLDTLNDEVRAELRSDNTLLVVDEIITAFREKYGSCNQSRRVDPDIVIFGKALALGFPVGMVLVNQKLDLEKQAIPFWGGTFAASPWQIFSIRSSLGKLQSLNYSLLEENLYCLMDHMSTILNGTIFELRSGCGFCRVVMENKQNDARAFLNAEGDFEIIRAKMRSENIYLARNALVFPSVHSFEP